MFDKSIFLATLVGLSVTLPAVQPAHAGDRYQSRPPVIVSPDLSAPWVMQLGGAQQRPVVYAPRAAQPQVRTYQRQVQRRAPRTTLVQPAAVRPNKPVRTQLDPAFLPQMVAYDTPQKPGTIVIDTNNRFLYLVTGNGQARRYGVGVGKPGFEWAGQHKITAKKEWPSWTPPAEMITREAAKGHYLPARMDGGPENPLGARAMYLGSTLYRIHGTNAPWTIGNGVSSGCIRMRNEDVVDLYERVNVGTSVIVM
ncbi:MULTISPECIES: L,D-transpeptidase [Alphaproteobacteria]|uniref:L,D-transpeptidase n=2 Tax=Alphaproteobacteria TaxID=28211 RepID=A0A512HI64_9HYPH|nr:MULTISPECIES: L,D-transpeptidase [Alphaproteobacteria]GEO85133.1 L,D-transpeptidase [Ciceribacter naphthalenivorans]GLR24533.1 L,D-transpeptidase [Ciceribacter naphthalenivorans]GLT07389.1 L,D-transpeptidase [Sphingomonas psychrolutea]